MTTGSRSAAWSVAIALLLAGGSALAGGILLSPELLDKIKIGVTTEKEVEQILGPPRNRSHFPRLNQTSMDYDMQGDMGKNRIDIGVMIGNDGIVRDVQKVQRYAGGS
jgi:hypothetical protein